MISTNIESGVASANESTGDSVPTAGPSDPSPNPSPKPKAATKRSARAPKATRSSKPKSSDGENTVRVTTQDRKVAKRRRQIAALEARWGAVGVPRPSLTVAAERALVQRLGQVLVDESGLWAGYRAHQFEPQIDLLFDMTPQIRWVFPRVEGRTLMFFAPLSRNSFVANSFGLLEPDPTQSRRIDPMDLRGLLIPGVAFDVHGYRLGRGGGYYDRLFDFFAQLGGEPPYSLGVAFDDQLEDEKIPIEQHDRPLDGILTDRRAVGRFFEERELK